METQKIPNSQSNLEKKEQSQKYHAPYFKVYYKAVVIKKYAIGIKTDSDQ